MNTLKSSDHHISESAGKNKSDIDLIKIQHDLEASEVRYRRLFETAQDGILLIDFDTGVIVDVNPYLIKMLGYSESEILHKHLWEIGVFKNIAVSKENFKSLQNKGFVRFDDLPLETKDKRKINVEFVANAYKIDGEKIIQCNIRDITQRKKAEILLRESESRFRQMFENGHFGIFLTNKNLEFIKANPAICKILGYTEKELVKKKFTDITYGERVKRDIKAVSDILDRKIQVYRTEKQYIKKNREIIWVRIVVSALRDSDENFLYFLVMVEDINKYKVIENALRQSEEEFSDVFKFSPYVLTITRIKDGKFLEVNNAFVKLSGITRKEALSGTSVGLGVWSIKKDRQKIMREIIKKGYISNREFPFKSKKLGVLTGLYSAKLIIVNGEQCVLSSIADITKLKLAEKEVLELKNRDEAMLASIGDAVFACDSDGKILLFNKMAEHMTGLPPNEAIGRHYNQVFHFVRENDGGSIQDFIAQAIKTNTITRMERNTLLIRKDGTKTPVADSAAPIKSLSGKIVGCVVVFHDVTKDRQIDSAKTEFVSLASHQLRTPLTAINWYCEMLLNDCKNELNPVQENYAKETYKASKRMVALMNALLNVSRLEMGTFMVEPRLINIIHIAKNCLNDLESQIIKKKIIVLEKYDSNVTDINADPRLIGIVFQNLLTNAVKYTKKGGE